MALPLVPFEQDHAEFPSRLQNYFQQRTKGHGVLIYLKPTLFGNEPVELLHYANAHASFPHQSTIDQNFDEKQFEAHRELGYFTMKGILEKVDPADGDLRFLFDNIAWAKPRKPANVGGRGRRAAGIGERSIVKTRELFEQSSWARFRTEVRIGL